MATDTALTEKREELKRRLAAGEYKTLVDIFLERFDRLIRKITRQAKPLPNSVITVILSITFVLIAFMAVYTMDDLIPIFNILKPFGTLGILTTILYSFQAIASVVVINQYIGGILVFWRNSVLDATESVGSLEDFEDWLDKVCNQRLHFLVTIIGGFFTGLYLVSLLRTRFGVSVGYGTTLTNIILSMFSVAFVYIFFAVVLLSAKLRRYDLKLFSSDPSSSEILSRLSSELNFVIYFVAFYAAVLTLISAWIKVPPSFVIVLVVFLWIPITAMFALNQTSLSSIIRRVKWKTLNEIQMKVEKLQTSKNFGNQETMDAIKRLMDYHDRVKATRDSALDFRTYLSFINSLLLPLLAFLIGNLDLVLSLFKKQP